MTMDRASAADRKSSPSSAGWCHAILAAFITFFAGPLTANDLTAVMQPSKATYEVEFRGINAGTIEFTLRAAGDDRYVYESRSNARGIARLVVRNEVHESSTFVLADGDVRPLSYSLDDGSSDTAKDTRLEFDWNANRATGTHENQAIEIPLTAGVQDRISAQVAVMRALASGTRPERIAFIDRNELKHYVYTHEGTEQIKTPLGQFDTVVYSSTRDGSSRVSRIWYAPELGFTPVRAEQVRRGKVETTMTLSRLER